MKRLINSTTILSVALYVVPPFAAQAQDFPKVTVNGTEVMCLPDKKAECPEGAFCIVVKNPKNCEARAAEAIAAAAAPVEPAVDQAAADAAAAADKAAADAAAADAAAADAAAADAAAAAAKAAADQAAADQAAADQAAADKAARKAARKAAEEAAAAEAAAATEVAPAEATTAESTATEATTTEATTTEATTTEATATGATETEATTAEPAGDAALPRVTVEGQTFICLPDKTVACPEGAACVIGKTEEKCEERAAAKLAKAATPEPTEPTEPAEVPAEDAAAVAAAQAAAAAAAAEAAADPDTVIVDAPAPTEEAVETLESALDTPDDAVEPAPEPEVEADIGTDITEGTLPSETEPSGEATVTTEVLTEEDTRASDEEFGDAPVVVAPDKKTGLSDFEKVGLLALGALAIGAMINGNKQVVSNTGDRVVVRQPDGSYQVYKDDNALLREPGSTVRTETFRDGSTRTVVQRQDGSQIVTIRDATGRVLQRVAYDRNGRGTVLIDDLQPEERVDVTTLPKPRADRNQISVDDADAELRAQMAADDAAEIGRKFSLRQIRNIPEVRHLAPTIDVNNITFETGSSAIQATEARKLNRLGRLITGMIEENPNEVFLIEGHTDAVGSAASNLALSDRRAESVAKALTEYFGVPPENLVVQGYGEAELKIETQGDERANRRAAVRIITQLLRQGAN